MSADNTMSRMASARARLERYQAVIYFACVLLGAGLALTLPGTGQWEAAINPTLALMLWATFLQVPLAKLHQAIKNLRFMGALMLANFVVIPLLVALMQPWLPAAPLIRIAVLMVLLCPCVDYVVTFSHLGKADASLLLAATPVLLLVQMLLLPLYLSLLLGAPSAALVHVAPFVQALLGLIVMPLILAAAMQMAAKHWRWMDRVVQYSGLLPVPATALVLVIVIAAIVPQLGLAWQAAQSVLPFYLVFAAAAPVLGWQVARVFGLEAPAKRAVAFSSVTRNSLVILPVALSIPGALPVIPAVIVTQTLVELLAMLVYLQVMPRLPMR